MSSAAAECLELLKIQVRRMEKSELLRSPQVIIRDSPTKFWPRKSEIMAVRQALMREFASEFTKANELSYISRLNSDRTPMGEIDLERKLKKVGAKILHLETLSMREQIGAVMNTSRAIGPHGAGLSAIMFMDPGQCVFEMSSGDRFESCYRRMASVMNINYEYIELEGGSNFPNGAITPQKISQIIEILT